MTSSERDGSVVLCGIRFGADGMPEFSYADALIERIFGVSAPQLVADASPILAHLSPDDVNRMQAAFSARADTANPVDITFHVPRANGAMRIVGHFLPRREDGGVTWHGYLRAPTPQTDDLSPSYEERLLAIQESLPDGLVILRAQHVGGRIADFVIDYINPGGERLLGKTGLRGERLLSAFPSMREHPLLQRLITVAETGDPLNEEVSYSADGISSWFHYSCVKYADDLIALFQDIAPRKATEQALHESEKRLQFALDAGRMGVWEWDIERDAVYWSPRCYEIYGINEFGSTSAAFIELLHPDDVPCVQAAIDATLLERARFAVEFRIVRPDGAIAWLSNLGQADYDDAGKPVRMIGMVQDITEFKSSQLALRDSNHLLQTVIDLVPHFVFAKDRNSRHLFVNRACAQTSGMTPDEMIGLCDLDFVPNRAQAEQFMQADREVIDSGLPKLIAEEQLTNAHGETRVLRTIKIPFTAPGTGAPRVTGSRRRHHGSQADRERASRELRVVSSDIRPGRGRDGAGGSVHG